MWYTFGMKIEDEITSDAEAREQLKRVMRAVQEKVCERYEQACARVHAERRRAIFARLEMLRKAKWNLVFLWLLVQMALGKLQ